MQLRLLLLHPQQQGFHLRALQERHLQTLRGCSPMSLRQYTLQHPHRYVLRASRGLFERGLFVHSCPARVCLIAANNRLRISFVGADRCRFVCRSSNANWRPSSWRSGALCERTLVRRGEPCVASADAARSSGGIAIERCVRGVCALPRECWLG